MTIRARIDGLLGRIGAAEGSTRSAALIRILSPMLLWHRHYGENILYRSLDDPVHAVFAVIFFVGPALMIVGLFSRLAATLTAIAVAGWNLYTVVVLHRPVAVEWFIEYLVIGVACTDSGRSFSIDRALAVRRAGSEGRDPPPERGAVWGLGIICVHLSLVYFFAALDKSDLRWIQGERMERYFLHFYGSSDGGGAGLRPAMMALAIGVVVLEYALAVGLWLRAGRRWLLVPAVAMNLGFYALLPAGSIVLHTFIAYVAVFPPDEIHAFVDRQVM